MKFAAILNSFFFILVQAESHWAFVLFQGAFRRTVINGKIPHLMSREEFEMLVSAAWKINERWPGSLVLDHEPSFSEGAWDEPVGTHHLTEKIVDQIGESATYDWLKSFSEEFERDYQRGR